MSQDAPARRTDDTNFGDTRPGDTRPGDRKVNDGDGYAVLSYLLSGLVLWGGAGLLLDKWLGTTFLVLPGLLIGGALGLYLVYIRYGRS